MLKSLSNAFGVTGCEQEVADIIIAAIQDKCDSLNTDSMGNVIAFKKGTATRKTIMLAAHMDEVGLIVTNITPDGYIKFDTVGGIDNRILLAQPVIVGKNRINGVVCVKPKHLIGKDEKGVIKCKDMVIDIGAKSKEDAEKVVRKGDYICFNSRYTEFADDMIKGKALDDRVGCSILIDLINETYPNDIYFVFNTQEEIGCRGAKVSAFTLDVDKAIVVEGTTCSDLATDRDYRFSTKLGKGAAVSIIDKGSCADKGISGSLLRVAESHNIPVQYKQTTMGSNDASAIHISKSGIKTAVISVPCRYIHSPVSVASKADIRSCRDIVYHYLKED